MSESLTTWSTLSTTIVQRYRIDNRVTLCIGLWLRLALEVASLEGHMVEFVRAKNSSAHKLSIKRR